MKDVTVKREVISITKRWTLRDPPGGSITHIKYSSNDDVIKVVRLGSSVYIPVKIFKEISEIFNEIEEIKSQEVDLEADEGEYD
jgi:hypothetical protein